MNIYLAQILSLHIILIDTLTLNLQNICQCSQLMNEQDCSGTYGACSWNGTSCQEVACQSITEYNGCLWVSDRCYWSRRSCYDFTNCSSIKGITTYDCQTQNYYCLNSNGTHCGSISESQPCSAFNYYYTCGGYWSSDGPCVWNGTNCLVATSCAQFSVTTNDTCSFFDGCYQSGNNCLPKTCSYYKEEDFCISGFISFGSYLQDVIACQWNTTTKTCEDFNPSTVDINQCLQNSYGTYCWSDSNSTQGSCRKCFDRLLKIIFVVLICLFQ